MNNKEVIATISLGTNQVGFYDPATNIHLTLSRSSANVYAGMNVTNLRKAVFAKTIRVTSGSLGEAPVPKFIKLMREKFRNKNLDEVVMVNKGRESELAQAINSIKNKPREEVVENTIPVEPIINEESVAEIKEEVPDIEAKEEVKTKKRGRKKQESEAAE